MYSRVQFMLALAVVACSLCLVLALPAADEVKMNNKVRNPRLSGSNMQLGKRDDATFNIDLSGHQAVPSSSAVASAPVATAVPIASTSVAPIMSTTAAAPTPIATAATSTTHYTSTFTFSASFKDTNPLNDGLVYMASLSKKGKKNSKKSLASVKSASKAGLLTGTAAAAAAAVTGAA